jgi:hypothetical protein
LGITSLKRVWLEEIKLVNARMGLYYILYNARYEEAEIMSYWWCSLALIEEFLDFSFRHYIVIRDQFMID